MTLILCIVMPIIFIVVIGLRSKTKYTKCDLCDTLVEEPCKDIRHCSRFKFDTFDTNLIL